MTVTEKEVSRQILQLSGANANLCIRCGRCTAACPVAGQMDQKPHRFASLLLHGQADTLIRSNSIWLCLSCMACSERCPRGVDPARLVEGVRQYAVRPRGMAHFLPDQVPDVVDDEMPQQALMAALRKYRK